ncbi:MAG: protein kinase domain-containing protein [Gemmatimonadaceae bacterium]
MAERLEAVQRAFTAYTIERELGSGGMATVYFAHDKKHDRKVAIKILHAELAAVLGAERFLQEIKLTANLQHPHILGLIDSGLIDDDAGELRGRPYYIMPFVEGDSLRQRLDKEQQLPVSDSVRIATEVAGALDYAHRHGVIHRDIKPENILLHDGSAIVADFGIALAITHAGGARITQTGLSLGTPGYMSPEQAMGERTITARSDIYSLGAVTYEMLAGEPPFTGPTVQAVVARVMTEEPRPLTSQRRSVPPHVEAAVSRALQKVPADRFALAHEFADALTGEHPVRASDVPSHALSLGKPRQRRAASIRVAATVLVALAAGIALGFCGRPRPQQRFARLPIGLPDSAALTPSRWGSSVALSPDGSRLVYLGPHGALYVRSVDDFDSRLLEGTDNSLCASFSPDGRWILYTSEAGKITRVRVSGAPPVVIADHAFCGTWTDRDEIVFIGDDGGVYRVPVEGGNPVPVLSAHSGAGLSMVSLSALPGASAVLVGLFSDAGSARPLGVITLDDGHFRELEESGVGPQYSRSGHVLFARQGSILAAPFSLRTLRVTGPAVPIARDAAVTGFSISSFSAAADGTLAYVAGTPASARLYAVDLMGKSRALSAAIPFVGWPRISPDGLRVALEIGTGRQTYDIWVFELASRTLARLTSTGGSLRPLGWSADGKGIYYVAGDSVTFTAPRSVTWRAWDHSVPSREVIRLPEQIQVASVGPQHGYVALELLGTSASSTTRDVWIAPLDTPQAARPFIATGANERQPKLSRDGKYLAYTSDETGRAEVYVQPVPGPGRRVQLSADGGTEPVWDLDSRHVYYRGPRHMMRATVATSPQLELVRGDTLFEDTYDREANAAFYDVMPGGKELLMQRNESRPRLAMEFNWPVLLRQDNASR